MRRYVEAYRDLLAKSTDELPNICYAAGARKEHHEFRLAVLGEDAAQMRQRLGGWLTEPGPAEGLVMGRASAIASAPVFVYTGQGSQWYAMGRQLLQCEPVFYNKLA